MKLKALLISFVILAIVGLFTACKKYPENTVWFKNPTDMPVINGHITAYVVNGIDSLDLLNSYYAPVIPNAVYPYGNPVRDVKAEKFTISGHQANYYSVSSDLYEMGLGYTWSSDKKSITIGGAPLQDYYNKQIFIKKRSGEVVWQIVELTKYKTKIKTIYNDVIYEITFES